MAGPIYYFSGQTETTLSDKMMRELVVGAGLGDVLDGAEFFPQVVTDGNGPDQKGGLALHVTYPPGHPGEVPNTGYYPDDQNWVHVEPKGYWLGLKKSALPRPQDLQRAKETLEDYSIVLADGHRWSIMTIYPFERAGAIPRVGKRNEKWEWEWPPHPRYDSIIKRYEKVYLGDTDTLGAWADLAIDTLAVNYRIDKYLAMTLGIIESRHCDEIIDFAMDVPERVRYEESKKKELAPSSVSSTNSGDKEISPAIDQPLLT